MASLLEYLHTAREAARGAGRLVSRGLRDRDSVDVSAKSGIDLVTDVDKACEAHILGLIRSRYPDHRFIAEETAADNELTDAPTWVVDPIDGTTNFVHAQPYCAVSIGVAMNRELVVGVIFIPALDQLYHAVRGGGAFLNDQPIHVAASTELSQALVVNNIGASRDHGFIDRALQRNAALLKGNVRALRNVGSCCVAMAHVAAGLADCYYEIGVGGPWDMAAGRVIVEEAGGVVECPLEAAPHDLFGKRLLCGNAAICARVREALATVPEPQGVSLEGV